MAAATVLLSGGLDSTVLLHYVVKRLGCAPVYVLSVSYGQRHHRELEMARWQVGQLPVIEQHTVLDLSCFADLAAGASVLVAGGGPVPDLAGMSAADRDQPPTYVPNRNMILLALAAAYAEAHQCGQLYYGAQAQDEYGYWDCTSEFVDRMNAVFALNRRTAVEIKAPLVRQRKSAGVRLGIELGVDFAHTWSCYRGESQPCGRCPTCIERATAFAEAGISDPLVPAAGFPVRCSPK